MKVFDERIFLRVCLWVCALKTRLAENEIELRQTHYELKEQRSREVS